MPPESDPTAPLRAALEVTPDNVPLRRHLADTLASLARYDEAVQEYRTVLEQSPGDPQLQYSLADAYYQSGHPSEAAVILESLIAKPNPPAIACVLYARLALGEGRIDDAVAAYKQALDINPEAADDELTLRLGVSPRGFEEEENEVFEGRVRMRGSGGDDAFETELERPKVRFENVGGMADLKEEIRVKIIYPLEHPEIYQAYGKSLGGGIMMYGPPGCGKTFLARATAGEIDAAFLSIGINDVLDMWMGNSEKRLHSIFEQARANAPCVLFFDEVDALGGKRSDMNSGTARQLINQFLAELDGAEHSNDGVLVLAATNAPWHVDPAFRRPGRFDRVLFVPPPDEAARADILQLQCANKPTRDIDYKHLAKKTAKYSGADLKAILDLAIEAKLTDSIKLGGPPQPITGKDLLKAIKSHRATTQEWFSSARNYALYANQGGLYDDVLKWLEK
ncbi:ATP-binding protein [Aeoliella mucimassa]|uniref:ATP-dependent zinc metalloprotease FtsH n=1 Tax=Aeoliella mucimassa TaxID=2527972 RepID=A0A518AKX0_9BACT|nr:ATP-binding protein [Aeoliella mucimassa]QDU55379.1 ATP-dependent zinc metalloprotease FtsH [Aeoliella mucimassa]